MKLFEKAFLQLGERWKIRLPDSENALQQHLYALEEQKYEHMKINLERAYRLRENAIIKIQKAIKDPKNQAKWNIAYQSADIADQAIISSLKNNVHTKILSYQLIFGFFAAVATEASLLLASHDTELAGGSAISVFMTVLVFGQLAFYCGGEKITSRLIPHLTQDILNTAHEMGIHINSQQPLDETEALTPLLV